MQKIILESSLFRKNSQFDQIQSSSDSLIKRWETLPDNGCFTASKQNSDGNRKNVVLIEVVRRLHDLAVELIDGFWTQRRHVAGIVEHSVVSVFVTRSIAKDVVQEHLAVLGQHDKFWLDVAVVTTKFSAELDVGHD